MTDAYVQMVVALVVVVGVLAVIGFSMRKKQVASAVMQVVAYQSFGPRKGVALLKVGKEMILVALTSTDVKLLKTLDAGDFEDEATREISERLQRLKKIKGTLHEHQ
jgi:flagellar biogenesis protein FliO